MTSQDYIKMLRVLDRAIDEIDVLIGPYSERVDLEVQTTRYRVATFRKFLAQQKKKVEEREKKA
jgi:hypothetical protein